MELKVIKTILKDKHWFNVTLQGTHTNKCKIKQTFSDKVLNGQLTPDLKEIILDKPLLFTDKNQEKIKKVVSLKVPKESYGDIRRYRNVAVH